jgi:hypothetical protein
MLEGKFKDKTHLRCGYPLWKAKPTNIRILGTEYVAKCPRCFFDLPVIDVVDPDAPPEPVPETLVEVPEVKAEAPTEPEVPEIEYKPRAKVFKGRRIASESVIKPEQGTK